MEWSAKVVKIKMDFFMAVVLILGEQNKYFVLFHFKMFICILLL